MLPLRQTLLFAFLALSLFQDTHVVYARSGTNAARLAHGQSLVRPKRLYFPGLNAARDLAPSATPGDPGSSSSAPASSIASSSSVVSSSDSQSPPPSSSSDSAAPTSASSSAIPTPPPPPVSSSASSTPISSSSASATPTPTRPAPGSVVTGRVGLYTTGAEVTGPYKRDEVFVGYMGAYGATTIADSSQASGAWIYTYTVPNSPTTPVNLNHPGTPYRLSGVAIRSGPQVTLGPGNTVYLEAQNTRASTIVGSATSTYVYDTYAIGYAQTAIWIVDTITGQVTCQWVNPDGSLPQTFLYKTGSNVYITGDATALRTQLGNPPDLTPVALYHLVDS